MASPSPSSLIANLRPDIQGMFEEFSVEMNQQRMIALRVMPVFNVGLQAGPFGKITLESLLRAVDTKRNSGSGYNSTQFEFTNDSYATNENGIKIPVDRRNAQIYANYFDSEMVAARLARHAVMNNLEQRVAAKLFDSGTFTPTNVTNEWDDAPSATPITDVEAAVQRLYDKGIMPNALVMNWKVFRNLRNCDQVIERINSQGAGTASKATDVTAQMLAAVFDIPNIIVGGAQKNTANEGQTASLSPVWSNEYVAVTRVSTGGIEDPGWGRIFHWGGDGSDIMGAMETYYSEDVRADVVRCRMDTDEKVVYTEAVELLGNITT